MDEHLPRIENYLWEHPGWFCYCCLGRLVGLDRLTSFIEL
jgi:hypothetical protein